MKFYMRDKNRKHLLCAVLSPQMHLEELIFISINLLCNNTREYANMCVPYWAKYLPSPRRVRDHRRRTNEIYGAH